MVKGTVGQLDLIRIEGKETRRPPLSSPRRPLPQDEASSRATEGQALKSLLQRADLPVWTRKGLPLVFCGDALVCVPGIGVDRHFAVPPGEVGYEVIWNES